PMATAPAASPPERRKACGPERSRSSGACPWTRAVLWVRSFALIRSGFGGDTSSADRCWPYALRPWPLNFLGDCPTFAGGTQAQPTRQAPQSPQRKRGPMRFAGSSMIDPSGRSMSYLRVSVTDRCDFRCTCCMAEDMAFLPKKDLLSLEELDRLCTVFIEKGVRKLRLTGGEPLVRKNVMHLVRQLSRHLESGALEIGRASCRERVRSSVV